MLLSWMLTLVAPWTMACDNCSSKPEKAPEQVLTSRQPLAERASASPLAAPSSEAADGGAVFQPELSDLGPFDGRMLQHAGQLDLRNHYASSVMVTTGDPKQGAQCSGVLLSPRVALTAGSCVCKPRPSSNHGDEQVIDGSTCAERAHVLAAVYGKIHDAHTADMTGSLHTGTVRPHPDMKIRLDARSSVVSSHADLAIILLDKPVENGASPVPLADSEAAADELIITAGYGHDERIEQVFGERYFRRNKIAQAPSATSGRFFYTQTSADVHTHHGGWPCFRENGEGLWLVGVSSKASAEDRSCVSTYFFREWLQVELQRATRKGEGSK